MNARSRSRQSFPRREVAHAVGGAKPIAWDPVVSRGYGRVSAHWRVSLADGRTAFVKHALTREAATWLRKERLLYESVQGTFMPSYLGAYDGDAATLIVLEDLSGATWPPPWSPRQVDAVLSSLEELHGTPPPDGIESLEARRRDIVGWDLVAADPASLLATHLCSPAWLDEALPALVRA